MGARLADKLTLEQPGTLLVGEARHMLLPPRVLAELQKGVEDRLGPKASEFLYAAGAFWALEEARRLKKADPEAADLPGLFCHQLTVLGWGAWQVEKLLEAERGIVIRVERSPVARAYGQSDTPVCHLLAGAIAGLAETIFHVPASCTELSCAAQGANSCRFQAVGNDLAEAEGWAW